jgi:hypothetical protein
MKIFSGNDKALSRTTAIACIGINLLATPGLGTIMAGRWLAGLLQLGFAGVGFGLFCLWFVYYFKAMLAESAAGPGWMWQLGLILFAVGWLGSLWSSIGILRSSNPKLPPIIK